jgi:hypothetical protein
MAVITTRNFEILGRQIPIHIRKYDNGFGPCRVASNDTINFFLHCLENEKADENVVKHFTKAIKERMVKRRFDTIDDYLMSINLSPKMEKDLILFENPDPNDSESFMIGI